MTLIEAVLRSTGCADISELPGLPKEHRKKLAVSLAKLSEERMQQIPLEQWNLLLQACGGKPVQTPVSARVRLVRILAEIPADTPQKTSAGNETPRVQKTTENTGQVPITKAPQTVVPQKQKTTPIKPQLSLI